MDIVERLSDLRSHSGEILCVLAEREDDELTVEATRTLGLHLPPPDPRGYRHPSAHVKDGQVGLVLMVLTEDREQSPLHLYANDRGLVALGTADARRVVAEALSEPPGDTLTAVVEVVMAVARRCEEALDQIEDDSQELQAAATGYTSSPQRRTMGRLRAELFRIGETQAAQRNLLSLDEELAQTVGREHQRLIARAATAFGANHSMTTRLYAMLGDVLNEQDSVVSERLTLVATIFLPLTLVTGFFGMNFQWMVDGLGTLPAFLVLGLLFPAAMTVATLLLVRRLTRSA
ncbi:hypothetical protein CZ771_12970 [Actinomycetales bacterium JB111]|nr:hypothetical protein CZ771_12970 [Actinomycetales bacterium JB111]